MSENMCTNKIILDEKDLFLSIFNVTVFNQFSKTDSIILITETIFNKISRIFWDRVRNIFSDKKKKWIKTKICYNY